jgi:hypothetical protein
MGVHPGPCRPAVPRWQPARPGEREERAPTLQLGPRQPDDDDSKEQPGIEEMVNVLVPLCVNCSFYHFLSCDDAADWRLVVDALERSAARLLQEQAATTPVPATFRSA